MNRSRGILTNLLLSAATVALLLLGAEVLLRLTYHPDNLGTVIRFDRELGWALAPNAAHRSVDSQSGLEYVVRVNSFGVRDREFSPDQRLGRRRVLVLGDSFVFGNGVENDARFTDFLQRALGDDVDVINAGVPGWGTDQELIYFESVAERVQPEVVVLTMVMANDVANNMLDHHFLRTAQKPKFVMNGESLELTNSPLEAPRLNLRTRTRRVLRRSRLLLFVKRRLDRRLEEPTPELAHPHTPEYLRSHPDDALTNWSVYRTSYDEAFEEGFRVTEALLLRFALDCRRMGCELLVLGFPLRLELDDAWRQDLLERAHIDPAGIDMRQPYDRLMRFCAENGMTFMYPFEDFKRTYPQRYLYFERDEHPNIHAHALAARVLLDVFRERYDMEYRLAGVDSAYYRAVGYAPHPQAIE